MPSFSKQQHLHRDHGEQAAGEDRRLGRRDTRADRRRRDREDDRAGGEHRRVDQHDPPQERHAAVSRHATTPDISTTRSVTWGVLCMDSQGGRGHDPAMRFFRRKPSTEVEPERCPFCREPVPDGAVECMMCGATLPRAEVEEAGERSEQDPNLRPTP
jgi:hypothetical protein